MIRRGGGADGLDFFDTTYLYSKKLSKAHVELLLDYYNDGFPDLGDFAKSQGVSKKILCQRLNRIEKHLGVTNKAQLGGFLTTLALHSKLSMAAGNEAASREYGSVKEELHRKSREGS